MLGKGRECAGLFYSYHLNVPSQQLLAKYRKPEEDLKNVFTPVQKISFDQDGFYMTVKREVSAYFAAQGIHHKAPTTHVLLFLANVVLQLLSLYGMIVYQSFTLAIVHGLLRALMVVRSTHASSHFAFSRSAFINRWVYRIGTVMINLWSPTIWDLQHVVAHHIYTNEWPYDSDSAFPFKSIFPNQRRFWYHKYQHIYMWIIYALTIPLVMINSLRETIVGHQMLWRISYELPGTMLESYGCTIGSFIYLFCPFVFLPFSTALSLVALSAVVSSLFFSLQFVVNHEVDGIVATVEKPDTPGASALPPAQPENRSIDWGVYQMQQSHTFAPLQRLPTELAGGLNTQIEHHLFPGVHYAHYPAVGAIIQRVAKKFNVPYFSSPDLWSAIVAHYNLLKNPIPTVRSQQAANKNHKSSEDSSKISEKKDQQKIDQMKKKAE